MPLLDATGRYAPDPYSRDPEAPGRKLLPLEALEAAMASGGEIGVEVANTADVAALEPHFAALALIAVGFPAYGDGRGFTLAKRLRHAGFTGTLRAVGPLIADQFAYALACGFDELELPEANAARQPDEHWIRAAASFTATYQRGYPRGENILDARRAARAGGRNG